MCYLPNSIFILKLGCHKIWDYWWVSGQLKQFSTIYISLKRQAAGRKEGKELFYKKDFSNSHGPECCILSLCVTTLTEKLWENAQRNWLTGGFLPCFLFFFFPSPLLFKALCLCKTYGEKQCCCGWIVTGTVLVRWKGKTFFRAWWQMQVYLGSRV